MREVGDLLQGVQSGEATGNREQQVAGESPQGARLSRQQPRVPGALRETRVDDLCATK